jgi:ankyrin repeat protein
MFCQNEDGWTALHEACCSGHAELIQLLLSRGANVNARCRDSATPLHKAARSGCEAIICILLASGADPAAVDKVQELP